LKVSDLDSILKVCLIIMEATGRSGGLALLWKDSWELEIFNYSKHHMNVVIKTEDGNPGWRFTSFYGHPK